MWNSLVPDIKLQIILSHPTCFNFYHFSRIISVLYSNYFKLVRREKVSSNRSREKRKCFYYKGPCHDNITSTQGVILTSLMSCKLEGNKSLFSICFDYIEISDLQNFLLLRNHIIFKSPKLFFWNWRIGAAQVRICSPIKLQLRYWCCRL